MKKWPSDHLTEAVGELTVGAIVFYFAAPPYYWLFWDFWPLAYVILGGIVLGVILQPLGWLLDKKFPPKPPRSDLECLCGYDLRQNESGVCPECGRSVHKALKECKRRNHDPDWWEAFFFWRR